VIISTINHIVKLRLMFLAHEDTTLLIAIKAINTLARANLFSENR